MGVEHYVVCGQCKEYIDIHKSYAFRVKTEDERPPVGVEIYLQDNVQHDYLLTGGYWETRGFWFLWKHKEHRDIEIWTDSKDEWYDLEPNLKEVFKHEEDLDIREKHKK